MSWIHAAALAEYKEMKENPGWYKHCSVFEEAVDEVLSDT